MRYQIRSCATISLAAVTLPLSVNARLLHDAAPRRKKANVCTRALRGAKAIRCRRAPSSHGFKYFNEESRSAHETYIYIGSSGPSRATLFIRFWGVARFIAPRAPYPRAVWLLRRSPQTFMNILRLTLMYFMNIQGRAAGYRREIKISRAREAIAP